MLGVATYEITLVTGLSSFPVFSGKVGNLEKLEDFRKQEAGELEVEKMRLQKLNAVADGEPFGGV